MADGKKENSIPGEKEIFENIHDLRSKSFSAKNEVDIKKNLFGGYDIKEANDYIHNLNIQHNRTISAYQERIDEFSTYIEMLNKEKEDIIKSYKNNDDLINGLESKCRDAEEEVNTYKEEIEKLKNLISGFELEKQNLDAQLEQADLKYSEKLKEIESELGLSKENELLKNEIDTLSESLDYLQSENSVTKAELESAKEDIEKMRLENKRLRDEIAYLQSSMRKFKISQNMKIIEFSEKETFILKRSKDNLQNIIDDLQKIAEDTISFKKTASDEDE